MPDVVNLRARMRVALFALPVWIAAGGCQGPTIPTIDPRDGATESPESSLVESDLSALRIVATPVAGGSPGEWRFETLLGDEPPPAEFRYLWDFGDGRRAEGVLQQFVFDSSGPHPVTLTVYDEQENVVRTLTIEVLVELPLDATLTASGGADQAATTDSTQSATDPLEVTIEEVPQGAPPLVANAGPDQTVNAGDLVTLSGAASGGSGQGGRTFRWSQVSGTEVTLLNAAEAIASFEAPVLSQETETLTFLLTVTQSGVTATDSVVVVVSNPSAGGAAGGGSGGGGGGSGCTSNSDCDDEAFCNGIETCVAGVCQHGSDPCPGEICVEETDACVACLSNADCSDGLYCNGAETCAAGACLPGSAPCPDLCNEAGDQCVECLGDADCDDGDFCNGREACLAGTCEAGSGPFMAGVAAGQVQQTDVLEASGLAASRRNPGVLWTHDDSGGGNEVFAIDTAGLLLGTYQLGAGSMTDAEDIAVGPGPTAGVHYLYVGDIGDNASTRATIRVKRVAEPVVDPAQSPPLNVVLDGVDIITLQYPGGADAPAHKDSEAMFVDTNGDIYLVTKRISPNKVYRAAFPQSTTATVTLEYVATLPTGTGLTWITAADCSADGEWIIVRNDLAVDYANIWRRSPGTPLGQAFASTPCTILLQSEPQGEAIAWHAQAQGFYTVSEAHSPSEPLWYYAPLDGLD